MAFDLKKALTSIAPTLATMLGGPMAGTAISALESALGLTEGSGDDGITNIVQGGLTPETIAAVRAADQKHAEIIAQQGIDLEKINLDYQKSMVEDRVNARNTSVQGGTQWAILSLSLTILVIGVGSEIYVLFHGYPKEVPEIVVGRVLGLLDAAVMTVLGYHYGSSAGSHAKDQILASKN